MVVWYRLVIYILYYIFNYIRETPLLFLNKIDFVIKFILICFIKHKSAKILYIIPKFMPVNYPKDTSLPK
jgi:hypothetical protein